MDGVMTTKKDFAAFKKEFVYWQNKLGLQAFRIHFQHEDVEGAYAGIAVDIEGMCASVSLSVTVDRGFTREQVLKSAFHEACELLVSRLWLKAMRRFTTETELIEASHVIIRTLEDVMFDNSFRTRHHVYLSRDKRAKSTRKPAVEATIETNQGNETPVGE